MDKAKEFISNFIEIFNLRTLMLCIAACLSTWVAIRMGWSADYPMVLIGTAVIFPIVFSLNGAYARREEALANYAVIKASLRSIFYALTQWSDDYIPADRVRYAKVCAEPIYSLRRLLTSDRAKLEAHEVHIYRDFSNLSQTIEMSCQLNSWPGGKSGACFSYLNAAMRDFEKLKHIYQYRTPRSLQAFSDVFITVLPLLYGPVFANLANSVTNPILLYLVPALFAFILSSLDNIQAHLEDPFDGVGVDDIIFRAEKFKNSLLENADAREDKSDVLNEPNSVHHLSA